MFIFTIQNNIREEEYVIDLGDNQGHGDFHPNADEVIPENLPLVYPQQEENKSPIVFIQRSFFSKKIPGYKTLQPRIKAVENLTDVKEIYLEVLKIIEESLIIANQEIENKRYEYDQNGSLYHFLQNQSVEVFNERLTHILELDEKCQLCRRVIEAVRSCK